VASPRPSQRPMIEFIVQLVGDHLWQRGTICRSVTRPGETSCSAPSVPEGPSIVAPIGPGGPILGGPVVA